MVITGQQSVILNNTYSYSITGGTSTSYNWSVTNGVIVGSSSLSHASIKITGLNPVITCIVNTGTLTLSLTVCISVTAIVITGETNVNLETNYTYKAVTNGQTPIVYNWFVTGGDIISGQNSSTLVVKWKDEPVKKISINCTNCISENKFQEYIISEEVTRSDKPEVDTKKCIGLNSTYYGISSPKTIMHCYDQNNTKIATVNTDNRGYFEIPNVIALEYITLTQIQPHKPESIKSDKMYICPVC